MRIRLIKAHLKQILLCGGLVYVFISLLGEDEKPQVSIARRYKESQKNALENRNKIGPQETDELTLNMIEKMNGQVYELDKSKGQDKTEESLASFYAQIPGGKEAIAKKDPVALEAMKLLLQNLKERFISQKKISSDTFEKVMSSFHIKQMESLNNADLDDMTSKMMSRLIHAFPNLKGNIPAQNAIIQKLTDSNPSILKMMKLLQNERKNNPQNIQNMKTDELINLLDEYHHENNQKHPMLIKHFPETHGQFEYDEQNQDDEKFLDDEIEDDSKSNDYVAKQQMHGSQSVRSNSYQQGEINLHELLKLKNMLNNGATVEQLKKMYNLQAPQLIGRSLLAGGDSKETTGDTMTGRNSDDTEKTSHDDDIETSKQSRQTEAERKPFLDGHHDIKREPSNQQRTNRGMKKHAVDSTVTRDATIKEKRESLEEDDFIYMSSQEFDGLLEAHKGGVTQRPDLNLEKVRIAVVEDDPSGMIDNVTKVLTIPKYKQWKAERFIRKIANPVAKSRVKPTLTPYGDYIARPNPKSIIKDLTMTVDSEGIAKALIEDKKRRLALGDDDLLLIPEVKLEMQFNPETITNIVHFIWFSCRRFRVHHFMSMKSALHIHAPRIILLHTDCKPQGPYFEEFTKMAGPKLKIVKRTPPTTIWGNKIEKIEHRSDVARLQVLLEVGGIYMDDDVLLLKPLDPLMNNSIVLGEETYDALANSIVLANKNAWFLKRWYQEYKTFNGSKWSHSSCFVPWSLWRLFPDTIYVVKEKLLRPNWEELTYIYHELWDWTNSYSMHLYSRFMEALDGKRERSLQELAVLNTTYGEVSRFILWGDHRPRDVTDWL